MCCWETNSMSSSGRWPGEVSEELPSDEVDHIRSLLGVEIFDEGKDEARELRLPPTSSRGPCGVCFILAGMALKVQLIAENGSSPHKFIKYFGNQKVL
jgi:hypothetical protein